MLLFIQVDTALFFFEYPLYSRNVLFIDNQTTTCIC